MTLFVFTALALLVVGGLAYLIQEFNPCRNYPFPSTVNAGIVLHVHAQLEIFVNGTQIPIPTGIGGGDTQVCTQPLHNHSDHPAVIHIESPTNRTFTLGEFFHVWAASPDVNGPTPVVFDQNQIFGSHVGNNYELRMYVNGQRSSDYGSLVLRAHMIVVIGYGDSASTPWSTYQDASGQPWPLPGL